MSDRVEDRAGTPIEEGDTVFTKFRGGKREGEVSVPQLYTAHCMATKTQVLFKDQHGHDVAHNPETLEVMDKKESD
ncbi:hypothetical protein V491_03509 [Pseudogymnoascus sp. VKM F-3775]|nr:hypothetical protein V491_03509 [Pseudogymnoascus sp. VKM F-3775]